VRAVWWCCLPTGGVRWRQPRKEAVMSRDHECCVRRNSRAKGKEKKKTGCRVSVCAPKDGFTSGCNSGGGTSKGGEACLHASLPEEAQTAGNGRLTLRLKRRGGVDCSPGETG
jgi:hypothetical protein